MKTIANWLPKTRAEPRHGSCAGGVTIYRPETCVIDADVEVAPDTVIEPFVQLLGTTRVGTKCLIRSFTVIENCSLGNNVLVRQSCILTDSTVGDGAKIGPFAHLRPGSEIGEDAHVGNFVETKKTKLGKGAKASHLTYLGDAEIGEGTNIGAGVITCNYDGVNKHRTHIGKRAFVGSDSTLVAPVSVERRRLHRRRLLHHQGRTGRITGRRPCSPSHQGRLGRGPARTSKEAGISPNSLRRAFKNSFPDRARKRPYLVANLVHLPNAVASKPLPPGALGMTFYIIAGYLMR